MRKIILLMLFVLSSIILFAHPSWKANRNFDGHLFNHTRADSAHCFDVLTYDLTIDIDDQTEYISGTVETYVLAEENLTQISYELVGLDVDEVLFNGSPATYDYSNDLITISFDEIEAGDSFTTSVSYSGNPVLHSNVYTLGIFFQNNSMFTISDPNASRYWWPCYDHPWDKAETDIHVTMREDWLVAANGIRTSIVDNEDGTRTHHWDGQSQIATYLVSLAASDFVELNDSFGEIPIQNFVRPDQEDEAIIDFEDMPFMMEVFSNLYGPYPFEKYGNSVVNFATFGAMEHQTMTTLDRSFIDGNQGGAITIAHELAHQWYGDCLTPLTWKDVWLSESFATYSEAIYMEAWQGYDQMLQYTQNSIQSYYISWMSSSGPRSVYNPPFNETFSPPVYEKGASVLHMLRKMVGDDTFFEIMSTYFQEYHNSNVVTTEFIEVTENVSGLDLTQFFDQWIYGTGVPSIEYAIFVSNDENNPEALVYSRTNSNTDTEFYIDIPLTIDFDTHTQETTFLATPDEFTETLIEIDESQNNSITVDPERWILKTSETQIYPSISNAYSADQIVVVYWNNFSEVTEIDGYNLYRSESSEGPFEQINSELIINNSYEDNTVENGNTYYYRLTAVKNQTFEAISTEVFEATPMAFAMDQGILVVDETKDGNGVGINPTDDMVDDYYQAIIPAEITEYDFALEEMPSLETLSHYSTIIWHDDDMSQNLIEETLPSLGSYVLAGGNLIISGWKTVTKFNEVFVNDFLTGENPEMNSAVEFQYATSDVYPELTADADKLLGPWAGTMPMIYTFPSSNNGIYNYMNSEGSDFNNEPCGIKKSINGEFVVLGFPLYFMIQDGVSDFMRQILEEFDEELPVGESVNHLQTKFISIYPNPMAFNDNSRSNIEISYLLKGEDFVEIEIFNIKGQSVKSSGSLKAGNEKRVYNWNGFNQNNKPVPSGLYFAKVKGKKSSIIKKFMVIK